MTSPTTLPSGVSAGEPAPAGRARQSRLRHHRGNSLPYLLVAPLMLFIIGLALIPAGFTLVESFFRVNPLDPPVRFDGLKNFVALFTNGAVLTSMGNTALYVVFGVLLSTVLGILFATILQRGFRGRAVLVAILVLPWALPGVVEGIIWSSIYDSNSGLLNSVLTSLHVISNYQVFLGHSRVATILLIELVHVWQITPLSTLLILASLQNIPSDLYEAATIDGASAWKAFRSITLPLARPGITIAMVQAVIATLNIFDQPYILNGSASTASSVNLETFFISFQNLDFGQGYALSLLIALVTVGVSYLILKAVYRSVEY